MFSLATAIQQLKNNSHDENSVKSTAFWCSDKGIAEEIENYEPTQLNTLLERLYAEIKSKHG